MLPKLNLRNFARGTVATCTSFVMLMGAAQAGDPMASNNGLYPEANDYGGKYVVSNLDYPTTGAQPGWTPGLTSPLTVESAYDYAMAVRAQIEPAFKVMINDQQSWDPKAAGWYDMVWSGEATPLPNGKPDPNSGRDSIMNSYTGQIMPADTFNPPHQPSVPAQNHAVIYYNDIAAGMLGEVWENLYAPQVEKTIFPAGSIIVKAEAVTPTPEQWDVVTDASTWFVYRPTTAAQVAGGDMTSEVLTVRPLQMSVKIKDPVASPETGWVFLAFVYDKDVPGKTAWDRFVPLGIMWGDDPDYARLPDGVPDGEALTETWINPNAPAFTKDTLGWGGRLAGPMDVATRHNVITPSGLRFQGGNHLRASSCLSCHSSSEFPFTANLYPSPNKSFPRDGQPFMLYDPGSEEWARWFQNNPGTQSLSTNIGGQGLDYDMVMMFALSAYNAAVGNSAFVQERFHVH